MLIASGQCVNRQLSGHHYWLAPTDACVMLDDLGDIG